jgi:dynein light intermediate chain 1
MPAAPPPPPVVEDRNTWQDLLEKSASIGWGTAKVGNSTLVVVGDRQSGKSSVLNKFANRVTDTKNPSEFILDYSYINATNRFNLDKDDIVSRMKVWQLDDRVHWSLLAKLLTPSDLTNAAFVITVDLSKPWDIVSSLEKWIEVLKQVSEKVMSPSSAEQQKDMKKKISQYIQTYVESTEKKGGEPDLEISGEEKKAHVIDEAVPKVNLGVPLIIMGTKADYYSRVLAKSSADEKFEHVVRRLRAIALDHGAGLVFTSAFGEGASVQVLQDYVYTRSLGLSQPHAAKVLGVADDCGIFVPAGFDNATLLATKVSSRSGWTDATPLAEIFAEVNESKKAKPDASKEALVMAEDNESFFKSLREQLGKGVPFGGGEAATATAGKKQMVTSFFNNLLNKQ